MRFRVPGTLIFTSLAVVARLIIPECGALYSAEFQESIAALAGSDNFSEHDGVPIWPTFHTVL